MMYTTVCDHRTGYTVGIADSDNCVVEHRELLRILNDPVGQAAPELLAALKRMDMLVESLWGSIPWGMAYNLDIQALNEAPLAAKRAIAKAEPVEEVPAGLV